MTGLPCPNCGSELAFLEQYRRNYCYACGRYAPEGFGEGGAKRCPMCTGILSYVAQYNRYYCFRCNAYPPEGQFMETKVEPTASASPEPTAATQTALVVAESPKPEEQSVPSVEIPTGPVSEEKEPEEETGPTEEETVVEEQTPAEKPPFVRADIVSANKPTLMDVAKAYDIDPNGTKEQLRERLLSYLDEMETASGFQSVGEEISEEKPPEMQQDTQTTTPEVASDLKSEETPPEKAEGTPPEKTQDITEETQERIHGDVRREAPAKTAAQVQVKEAGEAKPASHSLFSASPRMIPATPKRVVEPVEETTTSLESPTLETSSPAPAVMEPLAQPVVITVPTPHATAVRPAVDSRGKARHPCPTCGRELTYVPQYDRWYCYSCRAYAPKAKAKFACPNCGASLRWISQYSRWWCDACRRYAAADLPRPERPAATATPSTAVSHATAAVATTVVRRQRSPGTGIGLLGFGMVLFVIYEILVDLPAALSNRNAALIGPDVAFALRFFAFVFVAVGAILGLSAVRDQRH